jgi:hypothetical protein
VKGNIETAVFWLDLWAAVIVWLLIDNDVVK